MPVATQTQARASPAQSAPIGRSSCCCSPHVCCHPPPCDSLRPESRLKTGPSDMTMLLYCSRQTPFDRTRANACHQHPSTVDRSPIVSLLWLRTARLVAMVWSIVYIASLSRVCFGPRSLQIRHGGSQPARSAASARHPFSVARTTTPHLACLLAPAWARIGLPRMPS